MSMAQTTTEQDSSGLSRCPQCKSALPPQAMFCGSCGERIDKRATRSLMENDSDMTARYRITSLVRRRSSVSLLFAFDNQQQRPVAIRDLDLSTLDEETRATITEAVKREYDLLRRQHMPYTMPVIDLRHSQGHVYLVTGWPNSETHTQLHTLQDLLQSGAGLPDERVTLDWITRLCFALEYLHRHKIVIGNLDPQTIILSDDSYQSQLSLMVSWLPASVRDLLPTPSIAAPDPFIAPEAMLEKAVASSDLYSLGAIFYLLLTGQPPADANTRLRQQRRLRSPRELNPRVSSGVDAFVTRTLALEPVERYPNASAMIAALTELKNKRSGYKMAQVKTAFSPADTEQGSDEDEDWYLEETVTITPLKGGRGPSEAPLPLAPPATSAPYAPMPSATPQQAEEPLPPPASAMPSPMPVPFEDFEIDLSNDVEAESAVASQPQHQAPGRKGWKKRVTGLLPSIGTPQEQTTTNVEKTPRTKSQPSWFKRLQEFFLGEQQHTTASAATIETPMRVQPDQTYAIRIRLLGRDRPSIPLTPGEGSLGRKKATQQGLSALIEGEIVYIEVRSVLYQSFAYIVQQAGVTIPAPGYAAEITIPMQALASGPSGRRDRLHIFFLDDQRRPLYEKPFVVEIFVSHLVQSGREGHNVLTIPL